MSKVGLFFDTETTGFKNASIVQIGAIMQHLDGDRRVLAELNLIIGINEAIPPETTAVHGITDDMAKAYGVPQHLAESIFAEMVTTSDRLIAHNIRFDIGIIEYAWPRAFAAMLNKEQYCTMTKATPFDMPKAHAGKSKWPKLTDAYRYFVGEEMPGAHDAMADVRGCRAVYFGIEETSPRCSVCEGLLTSEGGHEEMPTDRHQPVPKEEVKMAFNQRVTM